MERMLSLRSFNRLLFFFIRIKYISYNEREVLNMMGTIIFKLFGAIVIAAYTEFALGVNNR